MFSRAQFRGCERGVSNNKIYILHCFLGHSFGDVSAESVFSNTTYTYSYVCLGSSFGDVSADLVFSNKIDTLLCLFRAQFRRCER